MLSSSSKHGLAPIRRARWAEWSINGAAVLVAWQAAPVPARAEQVPDVVVFCDVSLREPLAAAAEAWRARTKIPVRVFTASLEQNASLVVHGARADIIVGIGAKRIDDAQLLVALDRGGPVVIGRASIVLAVHGASARQPSLSPDDIIDGLTGGDKLGLVDTAFGSAGPDARTSLSEVGLWPALGPRGAGAETTDGLKQLLVNGTVRVNNDTGYANAVLWHFATATLANPRIANRATGVPTLSLP